MSADTLRKAAALMRKDQAREFDLGHIDQREFDTWLAVAGWLDAEFSHQFGPTAEAIEVARAYLGETS